MYVYLLTLTDVNTPSYNIIFRVSAPWAWGNEICRKAAYLHVYVLYLMYYAALKEHYIGYVLFQAVL